MLDFFNIQDFPGLLDLHIYCANIYKDLPFTFFCFVLFHFSYFWKHCNMTRRWKSLWHEQVERKWNICTLLNLVWPCNRVMSFQNCNFSTNFSFQVSKPSQVRENTETTKWNDAHFKALPSMIPLTQKITI